MCYEERGITVEEGKTKKTVFDGNDYEQYVSSNKGHPWMVYISTCVAVCGSYQFGACVCSSPFSFASSWSIVHVYVSILYIYISGICNHTVYLYIRQDTLLLLKLP